MASHHTLDHHDHHISYNDDDFISTRGFMRLMMMIDNVPHQEFAEHFMVQVWREGRQVWEDYRDAQVCIMIIIILIIVIFIILILIIVILIILMIVLMVRMTRGTDFQVVNCPKMMNKIKMIISRAVEIIVKPISRAVDFSPATQTHFPRQKFH